MSSDNIVDVVEEPQPFLKCARKHHQKSKQKSSQRPYIEMTANDIRYIFNWDWYYHFIHALGRMYRRHSSSPKSIVILFSDQSKGQSFYVNDQNECVSYC